MQLLGVFPLVLGFETLAAVGSANGRRFADFKSRRAVPATANILLDLLLVFAAAASRRKQSTARIPHRPPRDRHPALPRGVRFSLRRGQE
jgi:hypothetical protein